MGKLHVVEHPLIETKLTQMRDERTTPFEFRTLLNGVTRMLAFEATRDLPTAPTRVRTPICESEFKTLADPNITIVPILRAGIAMVDGFLEMLPDAHVAHIGMERDEVTHIAREYYLKLPPRFERSRIIVVDPMLATGGSAVSAISKIKEQGCANIRFVNIVAAPEGVEAMRAAHPDVDIYTAALDEGLNADAYIVPGLGDAGDRIFNTI